MSETLEVPCAAEARAARTSHCHIVALAAPKGGVGKTTLSRALLVRAGQLGIDAIGVDFDAGQRGLADWAARREKTRERHPAFAPVKAFSSPLSERRQALKQMEGRALGILDLPGSPDLAMVDWIALAEAADLVLVPTGTTADDLLAVLTWVRDLRARGVKAATVINRARVRTTMHQRAKPQLTRVGPLCPVEVPDTVDVPGGVPAGLCALDVDKAKGGPELEAVWDYVAREVGL
jgi:chromosome partitioning protein